MSDQDIEMSEPNGEEEAGSVPVMEVEELCEMADMTSDEPIPD
jgi:hypothetical protein